MTKRKKISAPKRYSTKYLMHFPKVGFQLKGTRTFCFRSLKSKRAPQATPTPGTAVRTRTRPSHPRTCPARPTPPRSRRRRTRTPRQNLTIFLKILQQISRQNHAKLKPIALYGLEIKSYFWLFSIVIQYHLKLFLKIYMSTIPRVYKYLNLDKYHY